MSYSRMLRTFPFLNNSGEDMPAYAVFAFDECVEEGKQIILQARKCSADDAKAQNFATLAFNTGAVIEDGDRGACVLGGPAIAVVNGTITPGQEIGPKEDSWELWNVGSAFVGRCIDDADAYFESSTRRSWLVDLNPGPQLYRFTLNASLLSGTADADIIMMDGTDTGYDATVRDPLGAFSSLTTDDAGYCLLYRGKYYVYQAPCPS